MDKKEIKLQATRVFYENLACKAKVIINRGGARSSKTYSLMQLFMQKFLTEKKKRFLIIRKTLPSLKVSVWETFKMVLGDFGVNEGSFKQEKVMMNFYYMDNLLHFGGLDDPEKIKCYTPDTEVLTDQGWRWVRDIKVGDMLASLYPETGEVYYKPVTKKYEYNYCGDMYKPKVTKKYSYLSFNVTPEHRMLGRKVIQKNFKKKKGKIGFIKAKDINGRFYIPRTGKWRGEKTDFYEIPKNDYSEEKKNGKLKYSSPDKWKANKNGKKITKFEINNFLSFLGWYLSEGNLSSKRRGTVVISQKKKGGRRKLKKVLKEFPYTHWESKEKFSIAGKDLYSYLEQFGKCYDKFIPRDILELDKEHLIYLFEALMEGDGRKERSGRYVFGSTSKRLIDDVCELSLKLGLVPTVKKVRTDYPTNYPNGKDFWSISISKQNYTAIRGGLDKFYYEGEVYCFEVPPFHNVMIRHNGRVMWCGQSTEWNYIWMEEATDFTLQDYEILKLRLSAFSTDRKRNQMFLSFNPIDEEHWIKTDIMDNVNEDDKAEIVSTYKDNPFLSDDYIKQIKALENQNRNFYRIYTCGEWGRLEDLIYSNYDEVGVDPVEGEYQEIIYGVDFGYNNPSTLLKIWVGEDEVWERGLLYRSGLTNQELIKEFDKSIPLDLRNCPVYADAAEPDRIDEINRAGYLCVPFKKGPKSVINGINFVKMLKIHIVNSGDDKLLKEKRSYSWKTGKNGKPTDEPVKFGDHYMDAERGALYTHLDGSREFKIRWLG